MKHPNILPVFFSSSKEFRKWLEKNHQKATEIIVGYYKVHTAKPSMTWSESVDQAICFGWIDGIRRSIDEESYCIRFTPRKPNSIWSNVNIKKVEELTKQGLMTPLGIAAFNKMKPEKSGIYSFEKEDATLYPAFEKQFKANKKAWALFHTLPPSYRKPALHWVMAAKREETKLKRLQELIADSEAGIKVKHLRR